MGRAVLSRLEMGGTTHESFDKSLPLCYTGIGIIWFIVDHQFAAFIRPNACSVAQKPRHVSRTYRMIRQAEIIRRRRKLSFSAWRALTYGWNGCWGVPWAHPFFFGSLILHRGGGFM